MRKSRNALGPVQEAMAYADQIGLWDENKEDREVAIRAFLNEKTDERCACGAVLTKGESGGGLCTKCREAKEEPADPSREEMMGQINVPPAYRHCTFDNWDGEIPKRVLDYVLHPKGTLLLFGPDTGVGKTHLGTAALYSLRNGGHRCWWFSASELLRRLNTEEWEKSSYGSQPTWEKTTRVEVLMLDDLGTEEKTNLGGAGRVRAVLDQRFSHNRPTIVTTNLTIEQLVELDPRLASRLLAEDPVERFGSDRRI